MLACTAPRQRISAVALKVKVGAIKGDVVRVSSYVTGPSLLGSIWMALLDTFHHTALLVGSTGGTVALHNTTNMTSAPLLAKPIDKERLARLIVETLMDTATLWDGDTLVTAQDKTLVAFTSLSTVGSAKDWIEEAVTGHWAVAGTDFIMAIWGAVRFWGTQEDIDAFCRRQSDCITFSLNNFLIFLFNIKQSMST